MTTTSITFTSYEVEVLEFLASHFDQESESVAISAMPRFEELGNPAVRKVLARFARYGLINWQSSDSIKISATLIPTVESIHARRSAAASPDKHPAHPLEITESLQRFNVDHPNYDRNAFIMMQFGATQRHADIVDAIRETLAKYGISALRADDKEYHEDLFPNVLTYLYGSRFGIAVFERLEAEEFNPNVSLEVGYMRALKKSVCLLKDRTLKTLHTDLVGKLYKEFDPQDPKGSIPAQLSKWLTDKEIVTL